MTGGVVFESVSKRFGETQAVRELSLHAEEREFLVLVGPSGCGKTTALRMVAGLEEPTSGEIRIAGSVVNNVAPKDRDIAMVFQSYALYPHMTVFDNLAFGLRQRKTPGDEVRRRVAAASEMLGIESLMERRPKELSGGQRQRVALGRAIVRRPRVFLMDEPLSNLDAHLRLRTRAEIVALHRRLETTVIYVTHDQVEAMTMGTRIAVMKDGVLQQVDTPQRLYDFPVNSFVATFIGSPSMNMIEGELVASDGAIEFQSAAATVRLGPGAARAGRPANGRVLLGIRPEQLRPVAEHGAGAISGEVTLVERLGSVLHATIDAQGTPVVAQLEPGCGVVVGDKLSLRANTEAVHLFDAGSGQRLS